MSLKCSSKAFSHGLRILGLYRDEHVGTLYVGMTSKPVTRMGQHKSGEFEGFTKKYHCGRLVYYEKYDDAHKATARERQLKGWRRSKKIALIEKLNPRWEDLAEKWGRRMLFPGEDIKGQE